MIPGYSMWPMIPIPIWYDTDMGAGYGKIRKGYGAKFQDTVGAD